MSLLVVYVALALGFSFMCSVLEAVLLSVTPGYIGNLKQNRPILGTRLERLKGNVDRPLSAILSLNTLANTAGAAGAGAQAQAVFGSEVLALASAILTLLVLVISEIIPKTLGAVYWRQLAPAMTTVLPPLIFLMMPFVWLSKFITRLIKKDGAKKIKVSKEEIAALARLGSEQGVFDASESRILANLFRFGSLRARDIMTPRTVMFSLSAEHTVADVVPQAGSDDSPERVSTRVFSRIPICGESRDDVIGYVLKDALYLAAAQGELQKKLGSFARTILVVPEGLPVAALFEKLLQEREHIALVVDEYGGVDGVVSMEDVLETLIGLEIVDEADATEDMREMARRRWTERREALGTLPPPPGDVSELAAATEAAISKAKEGNS
ncbi:MAG: CBS domain containing-hemolysin-like protein [Polyangiales bacterium]|jgi:CBS domain containing-hemolysin-like protein